MYSKGFWFGVGILVIVFLSFKFDGFKKFVQSNFGAPSAQALESETGTTSPWANDLAEMRKEFDEKYATKAQVLNVFNTLTDEATKAGIKEMQAELARLDKEKLSIKDLCDAMLKCNCVAKLPKSMHEIEKLIVRETAVPSSGNTAVPTNQPQSPAVQPPVIIPVGDINNEFNPEITFGDNTFNFGDVTFPAPDKDRVSEIIIIPSMPVNVIVIIDEDYAVSGTAVDWCAEFQKCFMENCEPVLQQALAILCVWQKTYLTPAPSVVFTPGPSPTAHPWITNTPGATSLPGSTATPTSVIVPDPATAMPHPTTTVGPGMATPTPVPSSVPTATLEPTPTNATPSIPRSCAEGDIVSDRKDSFALYYNGHDLLQSCLKQEDRREAVEWSFTSPVGGWYRFDGIGTKVRYDHDKDPASPEITIVNYVNNVCVTLVKDGGYKVTQRPSNEGGIRFRPDPTCGGGPAEPTSTPYPIVTPRVGNPAPDPGTVRLLSTLGIDDPYRIVENSKMDIEQDLLPVEGQRDSFTREFVAPRNGRYLLKAVSSWIIGPNVNNGYGNDEEIRLQIGATYSVSTPNDRRYNGGIYLVHLGP